MPLEQVKAEKLIPTGMEGLTIPQLEDKPMKGKMKTRDYAAVVALSMMLLHSASAAADPVDMRTWNAESYPSVNGFPDGNWEVAGDGSSVTQQNNGQPTFFYSDFDAQGSSFTGSITPGTNWDDDFIGFALGFQPGNSSNMAADYLLIDWKQGTQGFDFGSPSDSGGGSASAGLAVSRVTGIPDADEFWQHANLDGTPTGSGLEELARGATLGSTGWVDGVTYEFTFDFGPNDLEVWVDGVLQFDLTGDFDDGRFAFYNFSQQSVTYAGFDKTTGSFPPPVSVPEPSSWALSLLGLLGFGLVRRRRSARF